MKNLLINILYYIILFFKYFYIYTSNFFTWFYNLLAKIFKWNVRFYYVHEEQPEDSTLNKIKAFFRFKKKGDNTENMATDYKQKYLNAKAQSDRNFQRYQHRKNQEKKFTDLYEKEKLRANDLDLKNQSLQKQIQALKQAQTKNSNSTQNNQNSSDNRTAMEIMGVSNGFTPKELKDAYKRLTSRYHPDKHIHMSNDFINETEAEFTKIQNAYNKIK